MPTITDVARRAGVSRTTVSRYLNGQITRTSETAEKIATAIDALGYHPNLLARSLRAATTQTVAVIVPDLTNPFYPTLLAAIERHLARHAIHVFVGQSGENPQREAQLLRDYYSRRIDGLVYVAATSEADPVLSEMSESIPVVTVDETVRGFESVTIRVDHERGAYQAAKYLLDLGHQRLTYLAGPDHLTTTQLRMRGLELALAERPGAAAEVIHGPYTMEAGQQWAQVFLAHLGPNPTAVLCANDLVALGVHRTLSAHGVAIPATLSLVGFDDIFISSLVSPTLTTIRQPLDRIGHLVADTLFAAMHHQHHPTAPLIVPPDLIVRESTAPPGEPGGLRQRNPLNGGGIAL